MWNSLLKEFGFNSCLPDSIVNWFNEAMNGWGLKGRQEFFGDVHRAPLCGMFERNETEEFFKISPLILKAYVQFSSSVWCLRQILFVIIT